MERKIALEIIGPTAFVGPRWEHVKREKALLFAWLNETSVSNVIHWRSISLRLGWPLVRYLSCFTFTELEYPPEGLGNACWRRQDVT